MREKGYLNLKTSSNEGRVRKAAEICKKSLKRILRDNAAEVISIGSAAIKNKKKKKKFQKLKNLLKKCL